MCEIVTVTRLPWTCDLGRRLFFNLRANARLSSAYPRSGFVWHLSSVAVPKSRLSRLHLVFPDAIINVTVCVLMNPKWTKKFLSRTKLVHELMNNSVQAVTGHTPWTFGRNGTVLSQTLAEDKTIIRFCWCALCCWCAFKSSKFAACTLIT
jgi:hypothetical protein